MEPGTGAHPTMGVDLGISAPAVLGRNAKEIPHRLPHHIRAGHGFRRIEAGGPGDFGFIHHLVHQDHMGAAQQGIDFRSLVGQTALGQGIALLYGGGAQWIGTQELGRDRARQFVPFGFRDRVRAEELAAAIQEDLAWLGLGAAVMFRLIPVNRAGSTSDTPASGTLVRSTVGQVYMFAPVTESAVAVAGATQDVISKLLTAVACATGFTPLIEPPAAVL